MISVGGAQDFSYVPLFELYKWILKSVQSTLSHLILTSVPRATLIRFLVEHELFQYYSQ